MGETTIRLHLEVRGTGGLVDRSVNGSGFPVPVLVIAEAAKVATSSAKQQLSVH